MPLIYFNFLEGNMKTNFTYKIDITKYLYAIFEIGFAQTSVKDFDFSNINEKICDFTSKLPHFNENFKLDEFFLSKEKISRTANCVGNAFFIKKQKNYFSKISDVLPILIAVSSIETNKKELYAFIENNLSENLHKEYLTIFSDLCNKYPFYKSEVNKIIFFIKRKINSKHKTG